jgi:biotin carboxyl carrier protein
MTFEIEVGGRRRVVSVVHADGGTGTQTLRVTIQDPETGADDTCQVDHRRTAGGLSWIYEDDRRSVDAMVSRASDGAYVVDLPRTTLTARLDRRGASVAAHRAGASAEQRLVAPLPGRIVKVLVAPGDEVSAGQELVVIEAMKMENALHAPRAGRVDEVLVIDGAPVEAGRLLVVVGPLE